MGTFTKYSDYNIRLDDGKIKEYKEKDSEFKVEKLEGI